MGLGRRVTLAFFVVILLVGGISLGATWAQDGNQRYSVETILEELKETEVDAEQVTGLRGSIARIYEYAKILENSANATSVEGYNLTTVWNKIRDARSLLEIATEKLSLGNIDDASEDVVAAKALLDQSMDSMDELAENLKAVRIEHFLVETESRLSIIEENITSLSSKLTPQVKNASLAALNRAKASLQRAREYMAKTMIDKSVDELLNVKRMEEEALEPLRSVENTGQEHK